MTAGEWNYSQWGGTANQFIAFGRGQDELSAAFVMEMTYLSSVKEDQSNLRPSNWLVDASLPTCRKPFHHSNYCLEAFTTPWVYLEKIAL